MTNYNAEIKERVEAMAVNTELKDSAAAFMRESTIPKYSYNWLWQDRPIIQYPQDIVAMQELIWSIKPDLIIETGIAHGGSLVFSASMLAQLDMNEAIEAGISIDPRESKRMVLGIDIDIRAHNRAAIEAHPMASRIQMIQGSSTEDHIVQRVREISSGYNKILVCLDSNHTHEHVLLELEAYAPLASIGSYCVVFDTIVDDLSDEMFPNRPWGPGNNPKTAVKEYLNNHSEFVIDKSIQDKLLITVAPDGYLKRIR